MKAMFSPSPETLSPLFITGGERASFCTKHGASSGTHSWAAGPGEPLGLVGPFGVSLHTSLPRESGGQITGVPAVGLCPRHPAPAVSVVGALGWAQKTGRNCNSSCQGHLHPEDLLSAHMELNLLLGEAVLGKKESSIRDVETPLPASG